MSFPVRNCALIGRFVDPRVAESMGILLPHLKSRQRESPHQRHARTSRTA